MNQGSGFLLIIFGLLILYVVITGKFAIVERAFYELFNLQSPEEIKQKSVSGTMVPIPIPDETGTRITLPEIFIPNYTKE